MDSRSWKVAAPIAEHRWPHLHSSEYSKGISMTKIMWVLCGLAGTVMTGCYSMLPSDGGGQTDFKPPRSVAASDVLVPPGYRIEVVATDLTSDRCCV